MSESTYYGPLVAECAGPGCESTALWSRERPGRRTGST